MSEVVFLYKCRRCGEIEQNPLGDSGHALMYLIEIMTCGSAKTLGVPIAMLTIHNCKDGGTGVADLIGYEPTEGE